jgi:hypothetical protein
MGSASASASQFNVSAAPATLNGALLGKNHVLGLIAGEFGEVYSCKGVAFSGSVVTKTFKTFTVNPELSGCSHSKFTNEGWTMNGCKFQFEAGTSGTTGKMSITGCEKPMTNTAPGGCTNEIGNQTTTGTVQYTNKASTVDLSVYMKNITFTRKGGVCYGGPEGTYNTGEYGGEWTLSSLGNSVQYESTSPPPPTKFASEEAPANIIGTQQSTKAPTFGSNGSLFCESTTYGGTMSTLTATSITVVPKYHGCTQYVEGIPKYSIPDEYISMGGCSYQLPQAGGFSIVGASCAAAPFTVTIPGCVLTTGPQTVASGFSYTNQGSGKERKVSRGGTAEGLTYTATGEGCIAPGTFSNATNRGGITFSATNSKGAAQGFWVE